MRLALLGEKQPGGLVQFRQAGEQLLQGIAHLPAFLMQLAGFTAGAMFVTQTLQGAPVLIRRSLAVGEQQGRFKSRQVEQQLIANPARCSGRVSHAAIVDGHFQPLGIAVAADRQLRAGQAQQRPGRIHRRTPN